MFSKLLTTICWSPADYSLEFIYELSGTRENHGIRYSWAWSLLDIHVKKEQTTTQNYVWTINIVFAMTCPQDGNELTGHRSMVLSV